MVEYWLRPWGIARPAEAEHLNQEITRVFNDFANLIQIHYHSGRSDTDFWRHQQTIPLLPHTATIREICQHRWPTQDDWRAKIGGAGYGVSIYPMVEYGWLDQPIQREQIRDLQAAEQQYRRELDHAEEISRGAMNNTVLVNRLRTQGAIRPAPTRLTPELRRLLELGR
jgi:hypothetical protein